MIYFIFPSKKNDWDGSEVDGGTYGVADLNYKSPAFTYDEVVKKKTKKKTDKDKTKKVLPKKIKKKSITKRKPKQK